MSHPNIRPGFLVTSEWLKNMRACPQQLGRFNTVFPEGMKITTRNLNLARSKYYLNTRWLIETVTTTWDELDTIQEITGVVLTKVQWTAKDAKLIHPAFIKVLKERDR